MTRDDIIRMAITCQLVTTSNRDGIYMEALDRFASLVAAAEREECAKLCESHVNYPSRLHFSEAIRARSKT